MLGILWSFLAESQILTVARGSHLGNKCLHFEEKQASVVVTYFTDSLPPCPYHMLPHILLS